MARDDVVRDAEPEAGASAGGLGRDPWFEDSRQQVLGMPMPVSLTSTRTPSPTAAARIVSVPPCGMASRLLVTRLSIASSSSSESAQIGGNPSAIARSSEMPDASSFGLRHVRDARQHGPSAIEATVPGRRE